MAPVLRIQFSEPGQIWCKCDQHCNQYIKLSHHSKTLPLYLFTVSLLIPLAPSNH